jgi:hypothetical protein
VAVRRLCEFLAKRSKFLLATEQREGQDAERPTPAAFGLRGGARGRPRSRPAAYGPAGRPGKALVWSRTHGRTPAAESDLHAAGRRPRLR